LTRKSKGGLIHVAENNVMVVKFSFSGLRTPWMIGLVAKSKINEWNTLRERVGEEKIIGTLAILYETDVPGAGEIRVSVKFKVKPNGHDANYYAEALKELGDVFAGHYQLERPPIVTGYPEN